MREITESHFAPSSPADQPVRPAGISRLFRRRLLLALGTLLAAGAACSTEGSGTTKSPDDTDDTHQGTEDSDDTPLGTEDTDDTPLGTEDTDDTPLGTEEDSDGCTPTTSARTQTLEVERTEGEACAESQDRSVFAPEEYFEPHYVSNCRDVALVRSTAEICTYEMTCDVTTSCLGRPYIDAAGRPALSSTQAREDWRRPVAVDVDGLDPDDRAQLAAFWLHNAAAEHSSVAGFHRFALDLLAHGAPPELIALAQRAAAQEAEHALTCFSLASAFAGHGLGPAPMPFGAHAPVASSLAQLAAWTLRDGAIGETIAAYVVAASLERTSDPEVRRLLTTIAEEELAHAELAWKTLRWALDVGGDDVLQALRATYQSLELHDEPEERSTTATIAYGILPPEARTRAVRQCVQEVVRPVFASLLATRLAA